MFGFGDSTRKSLGFWDQLPKKLSLSSPISYNLCRFCCRNQDEAGLAVHELFELASPSGSLVGFSITGELAEGMLQLAIGWFSER